jgi:ATP-dependent RNA circularization protein (DNA/RNA ligase family)
MTTFFRFPHTPHLAWLGVEAPRDDKLLDIDEVDALLGGPVVVEEKVDGANLGFSTTEDGDLLCQNRGTYLARGTAHPQFRPLWDWLGTRRLALVDALWPDRILFGEWCYALHSIAYDRLPDWFLGFDVYDRSGGAFWDTARRDALLDQVGLSAVPRLGRGHHSQDDLVALLGPSRLGTERMEGLVVRQESDGHTVARAKLVSPEFTQAIDTHWSRGRLVRNHLAIENAQGHAAWP